MRRTKIICTIGPACESVERLWELMLAGMNVARFNFSHGTHEEQREKFQRVLQAREEVGLPVATMLDTKGPEIRLRDFEGGRAELVSGQRFVLTTEEILGTAQKAAISYKNLKNDIKVGTTILIDDGGRDSGGGDCLPCGEWRFCLQPQGGQRAGGGSVHALYQPGGQGGYPVRH